MKTKWFISLAALALPQCADSRALKTLRQPVAHAVWAKELEEENEDLRRQNRNLESMVQMQHSQSQENHREAAESCGDIVDVLKQEISDLKEKLRAANADKKDLVQSLRGMLTKNATYMFQRRAEQAEEEAVRSHDMKMALELKFGKEKQALEAQVQEAKGKCDDVKEAAQGLQEENGGLQAKLSATQTELAQSQKINKDLTADKNHLLATLQGLMRDDSKYKHGLEAVEKREAQELATDKVLIGNLQKNMVKTATTSVGNQRKPISHWRRPDRLSAADLKHLKDIDRYMDNGGGNVVRDAAEQQLQATPENKVVSKKIPKPSASLRKWLGLPTMPPAKVAKEPEAPKSGPASLDDEADALVTQAKAQLAEMQHDE